MNQLTLMEWWNLRCVCTWPPVPWLATQGDRKWCGKFPGTLPSQHVLLTCHRVKWSTVCMCVCARVCVHLCVCVCVCTCVCAHVCALMCVCVCARVCVCVLGVCIHTCVYIQQWMWFSKTEMFLHGSVIVSPLHQVSPTSLTGAVLVLLS